MFLLAGRWPWACVDTTSPLSVVQQPQQHHQHPVPVPAGGSFPASGIGSPNGLIIEDSPIAPSSQYIVSKDQWNGGGAAAAAAGAAHGHGHGGHSSQAGSSSGSSSGGGGGMANGGGGAASGGSSDSAHPFSTFFDISQWTLMECFSLRRTQHLYYQLGNGLFLLAFLAPNAPFGMLWLRCVVIAGCVLLIIWGWQVECTVDVVVWASLFLAVNAICVGALLVRSWGRSEFEEGVEAVKFSGVFVIGCIK
ncbi:hypothetical protein quinque_000187, partial [Culex quinquefasciatus]